MILPSRSKRQRAERAGHWGEWAAMAFLMLRLYRIRARRFKTPMGEIDLIASRFGTTIFVEVKTRSTQADRELSLSAINRGRIVRAAQFYLMKNPHLANTQMRFDVMVVAPYRLPHHITHAFEA